VSADEVEVTFNYAEKSLKLSEKACDAQVGSTYSAVYEICRTKIDSHVNFSLENFQWVAKAAREAPNPYCEGLIGYLRSVFGSLGPMDEGSKAGLHFSCCGKFPNMFIDKDYVELLQIFLFLFFIRTRLRAYGEVTIW
jgi:hypothetical protein